MTWFIKETNKTMYPKETKFGMVLEKLVGPSSLRVDDKRDISCMSNDQFKVNVKFSSDKD